MVCLIFFAPALFFFFLHFFHVFVGDVGIVDHPLVDSVREVGPRGRFGLDVFVLENRFKTGINRVKQV